MDHLLQRWKADIKIDIKFAHYSNKILNYVALALGLSVWWEVMVTASRMLVESGRPERKLLLAADLRTPIVYK